MSTVDAADYITRTAAQAIEEGAEVEIDQGIPAIEIRMADGLTMSAREEAAGRLLAFGRRIEEETGCIVADVLLCTALAKRKSVMGNI